MLLSERGDGEGSLISIFSFKSNVSFVRSVLMKTVAGSCLIGVKKEARVKQGEREVCGIFLNGYLR